MSAPVRRYTAEELLNLRNAGDRLLPAENIRRILDLDLQNFLRFNSKSCPKRPIVNRVTLRT